MAENYKCMKFKTFIYYEKQYNIVEQIDLLNEQDEKINELKKENERLNNEIELLRNDYLKIPKGIRDVWKE